MIESRGKSIVRYSRSRCCCNGANANLCYYLAFAPAARQAALEGRGGIIHFEIQPKNINKVVNANIAVTGDVITNLASLLPLLPATAAPRTEWFDKIAKWKAAYPFTFAPSQPDKGELMKPQEVVEALNLWCENNGKDKVIISTGVGQHQMWAAQHYRWRSPRSWVSSGGLGVRSNYSHSIHSLFDV